jgi:hypothetical protein
MKDGTDRKKKKMLDKAIKEEENSSLNDRVFVCLGRLKSTGASHAWVMTLNKTYDELTFWEIKDHKKYVV